MPLNRRPSVSQGRRPPGSDATHSDAASDYDETILDRLQRANTECNKANDARDKCQRLLEQANKKLSETNRDKDDLKAQLQAMKEHTLILQQELQKTKEAKNALIFENHTLHQNHAELKANYDNLAMRYSAMNQPSPTNPMVALPERPAPKKKHSDERGRGRDRDRERDREQKEQKEQKAEKARLSRRFDDKRPPLSSNQRNSFIEGWGPGGRSSSATPGTRSYQTVATGRIQPAALTKAQQPSYSNVPRTTNALSPGYTTAGFDFADNDSNDYEDGNYHPHPIPR